jgi:hypothetical protein
VRPIVRTARSKRRIRSRIAGALAGAALLATIGSLAGMNAAMAGVAKPARTPRTFTHVSGSPNPALSRRRFKVIAMECDRVADVQATGKMAFVDVTTGVKLGTATMSPSRKYVNCGQAVVTDHEKLRPGKYEIRASYKPGGNVPVPRSAPGHYRESMRRHKRS